MPMRDDHSLNVLIPMGGRGESFREAGYAFPKPLIKIAGRPMLLHLLDNLQLRSGDIVWMIMPSALYVQYEAELDVQRQYPQVEVRVVPFKVHTHGAVETLYIGLQHMSAAELNRKTVCLDCDNLYFSDVLGMYRRLPKEAGACFYFVDEGTAALYSYIALDEEANVLDVQEKNAISDKANVGAYGFPSAALLRSFCQQALDSPEREAMKFYLSTIIRRMVRAGHVFVGKPAKAEQCGTPAKLEQFIGRVSLGQALTSPKRRFCFALDGVLVTAPEVPSDLRTVKPIEKNITLVRELKLFGHYIIITTSRLMSEHGGNVNAVIAACGNVTLQTLAELDIPYDEIHFGQPHADLYIDRSVAHASNDTEKDIGWRVFSSSHKTSKESGMVAARHFNNIALEGDMVIKTAATSVLKGEIFFYTHMPADVEDLFPSLISCSTPRHAAESSAEGGGLVMPPSPSSNSPVASMTLARIHGVTFSHLVTARSLTPGRLTLLLRALRRLHSSAGDASSQVALDARQMCANYLPKISKRFDKYRATYLHLNADADAMFAQIREGLSRYQEEAKFVVSNVVHGDPVFSNVLLTSDPRIFLLDMRGELGEIMTLQGDLLYDLSKVYQSLFGYDFIILGVTAAERDYELLEQLRDTFRDFVGEQYPQVSMSDVEMLTASHYFGIVPLHTNKQHQLAYLQTCAALLSRIGCEEPPPRASVPVAAPPSPRRDVPVRLRLAAHGGETHAHEQPAGWYLTAHRCGEGDVRGELMTYALVHAAGSAAEGQWLLEAGEQHGTYKLKLASSPPGQEEGWYLGVP
mmetsp:Transcript_36127/g.84397  ORF Transcript_36127/g.84397 Transcript_36127/m.84397 type:complete len:805 (-) Transcript_36127:85-2499(-)